MMGMFFFLTQFLREVLGYSDLLTGFAFLPLTVMVFAASQLSARVLVDRLGTHRLMLTRDHLLDPRHALAHPARRASGYPDAGRARCWCSGSATGWRSCR